VKLKLLKIKATFAYFILYYFRWWSVANCSCLAYVLS